MERLTIRMDHGIVMNEGYDFGIDPDDYDLVQEILAKLAEYEDSGYDPAEYARQLRAAAKTAEGCHNESSRSTRKVSLCVAGTSQSW